MLETDEEEPVQKTVASILMKTVAERDLSKQECIHILLGLSFVECCEDFITVNVTGSSAFDDPASCGK